MPSKLKRRHVLRGAGALIALPAIESLGFRRFASAAETAPAASPKRMIFVGIGYGVTSETWFPDVNDTGAGYKLPEGLKPLARHKNDFTIVQGCKHHFSRQAHWGSMYWLTGANQYGTSFYTQVSYYAVHLRTELLQTSLDKYQKRGAPDRAYSQGWAGMLEELDSAIGRLLDELDALGIAGNTYVVFTTDNGGRSTVPGGDPKSPPPNVPLSGAKHSLLEGGIRVPLMVRGPSIEAGSVCRIPVAGYDFLPTFYELAGGQGKLSKELDGGSFVSLLSNPETDSVKRPIDGLIFSRPRQGMAAIRTGQWKLLAEVNAKREIQSAKLFNVAEDIAEEHDLSTTQADKAWQLQSRLQTYLETVVDPSPTMRRRKKAE